jgi:type IV secretory pathway VirB4 component
MMNLVEYRRSITRLADFLPWAALVDEGIVLNKDGSFQRTARFRGPDLDSSVPAELVAVAGRLNNSLRRLGSGWAVFVEAQRYPSNAYPASSCPDVASALVDAERRAQFEEEGAHYESAYFLTFVYLPPAEMRLGPSAFSMRDGRAVRPPTPTRSCAAFSTAPTACCNWSKGSCRSAGGLTMARL